MELKYMLQFLKGIFFRKKLDAKSMVEAKYFEKYRDLVNQEAVQQLLEEYKSGDIIFEPPRSQLTQVEQEELYARIDKSNLLSSQEKFETIIGLMMILDGSFPEAAIVSHLEKVFGKEFVGTIETKRDEFKTDIAVKKLIRFVKWKYGQKHNRRNILPTT